MKPRKQPLKPVFDVVNLGRVGTVKVSLQPTDDIPITSFRITKVDWKRVGRHPKSGGLARLVLTIDYVDET